MIYHEMNSDYGFKLALLGYYIQVNQDGSWVAFHPLTRSSEQGMEVTPEFLDGFRKGEGSVIDGRQK